MLIHELWMRHERKCKTVAKELHDKRETEKHYLLLTYSPAAWWISQIKRFYLLTNSLKSWRQVVDLVWQVLVEIDGAWIYIWMDYSMKGDLRFLFRLGQGWADYLTFLVHVRFTDDILDLYEEKTVKREHIYLSIYYLAITYTLSINFLYFSFFWVVCD